MRESRGERYKGRQLRLSYCANQKRRKAEHGNPVSEAVEAA